MKYQINRENYLSMLGTLYKQIVEEVVMDKSAKVTLGEIRKMVRNIVKSRHGQMVDRYYRKRDDDNILISCRNKKELAKHMTDVLEGYAKDIQKKAVQDIVTGKSVLELRVTVDNIEIQNIYDFGRDLQMFDGFPSQ